MTEKFDLNNWLKTYQTRSPRRSARRPKASRPSSDSFATSTPSPAITSSFRCTPPRPRWPRSR